MERRHHQAQQRKSAACLQLVFTKKNAMAVRFNLVQLRAFVAAAEALNFTVAADRVHVAQPTFSATIRSLEEQIGGQLFERSSRKVRLTHIGSEFLPLARQVLDDADRAAAIMADVVSAKRGAVKFSALSVLYAYHLQEALVRYGESCPDVRLELFDFQSGEALDHLRREQLDLAIVTEPGPEREIQYTRLCDRCIVAVMRPDHRLAKSPVVEWAQLLEEPVAVLQGGGPLARYVDERLLEAGMRLEPRYRVEQVHTAMGIVAAGLAIGAMSNITASALCREGKLVAREVVNPSMVRPLSLAHLADREVPPAADKLRQVVLKYWTSEGLTLTR
jgi:LysR family transcriptional regulator, carnitine catabolism transcriptional activator